MKFVLSLLGLMLLGVSQAHAFFAVPGKIEVVEVKEKNFFAIELTGTIAYPLALDFDAALTRIPLDARIIVFLSSPGGSTTEGMKIISRMKREIAQGRNIQTHVRNGQLCGSMCVPIFVQGKTRSAGEAAVFMFHGSYQAAFTNIPDPKMTALLLNLFIDAGVNPEWLDGLKAREVFSAPGEYYVTGKELFDSESKVLTEALPRHVRFEPWKAPIDPNMGPR